MAPVTFHKGNSGGNSRGRSYGLMILVAFGAALFGVMVIHKLRERRIFNLLVQEKDTELISLQLLLQKERDYAKEMKRKTEEINAKLNSLQNQKMELDSRLLEMQSTVASIKDEQKVLESTLDEKQNEIKWLRERDVDSGKGTPQLTALMETLKEKESEIEVLRNSIESTTVKLWPVSSDDPSKPIVNLTESGHMSQKDVNLTRGGLRGEMEVRESLNSSGHAAGWDNGMIADHRKQTTGEQTQTVETLQSKDSIGTAKEDNGNELKGRNNEDSQEGASSDIKEAKKTASSTSENGSNVEKFTSYKGSTISNAGEDLNTTDKGHKRGVENHHEGETGQADVLLEGDMKMEMPNKFKRSADLRGKHGLLSRAKGRRWRMIAKDRHLQVM